MENTNTSENVEVAEFDLKHRITGAAVLLFFGALVLPWLLGPPSVASKANRVDGIEPSLVNGVEIDAIGVNGSELQGGVDIEETVYISKITPLDVITDTSEETPKASVAELSANVKPVKVDKKQLHHAEVENTSSDASKPKTVVDNLSLIHI